MSSIKEWIDECFSKELRDMPFKPKGAVNIVVYDKTNVPPPGAKTIGDRVKSVIDPHQSLTFWWKVGSFINQLEGFANYTIAAASWPEALTEVQRAVERHSAKTGERTTIASLQFWGHGSPGNAFMGNSKGLSTRTIGPGGEFRELAKQTAALMHPEQGHIWFRCCSPFHGATGQQFAKTAAAVFGVPVVGHTFTIHALQSGTRVLRPGQEPDWDEDEGTRQRGRRKGEDVVSGPLRKRTVTMFRLYPPMDNGEIILPGGLVAAVGRGISRIADDD